MRDIITDLVIEDHGAGRTEVVGQWLERKVHADPFSRIYYVVSGTSTILFDNQDLTLRPGHFYLIPSKTPIRLNLTSGPLDHYWFHFTCLVSAGITLFDVFQCPVELPKEQFAGNVDKMERLLDITMVKEPWLKMEYQALIRLLLVPFIKAALERDQKWTTKLSDIDRFQPVLKYIEKNLDQTLEVSMLAKLVNMHPTYLSNTFSKKFGMPLVKYINRQRLIKAQWLLLNTSYSIKEIALMLGFNDEFYFSRLFTKNIGESPKHYRQQKQRFFPQ